MRCGCVLLTTMSYIRDILSENIPKYRFAGQYSFTHKAEFVVFFCLAFLSVLLHYKLKLSSEHDCRL